MYAILMCSQTSKSHHYPLRTSQSHAVSDTLGLTFTDQTLQAQPL